MTDKETYSEQAYRQTLEVLRELVHGLDDTYWTSWQSTAAFYDKLEDARAYLEIFDSEYKRIK